MIRLLSDNEFPSVADTGMPLDTIKLYLKAYGCRYDFCKCYGGDGILLLIRDSTCYFAADSNADFEQAAFLINMLSPKTILANFNTYGRLSEFLGGYSAIKLPLMKRGLSEQLSASDMRFTDDYRGFYDIALKCFDISETDYDNWYINFCHLVRHNLLKLAALSNGRRAVSIAAAYLMGNDNLYITHFCTLPRYRKKGYGKQLLDSLQVSLKSDLYLLCEDKLCDFYRKIGFVESPEKSVAAAEKER